MNKKLKRETERLDSARECAARVTNSVCQASAYERSRSLPVSVRAVKPSLEDKKKMIEKAAELYREEVQQMKLILNHFKRGAGDLINIETSVEQFKKKLMEQE